jgi:DNA-binding response OmpR family regulator
VAQRPDMTISPHWPADRETLAKIADLTDRLEQSEEEVRFLKAALTSTPDVTYEGLRVSKAEKVVIEALFAIPLRRATQTYLRGLLDVALNRKDAISLKTVDVVVCRLRKKFKDLVPPVAIQTEWGAGYFLTDDDRELLAVRRHVVPERRPPTRNTKETKPA